MQQRLYRENISIASYIFFGNPQSKKYIEPLFCYSYIDAFQDFKFTYDPK